jgi:hypothetical protein
MKTAIPGFPSLGLPTSKTAPQDHGDDKNDRNDRNEKENERGRDH